MPSSTYPFRDSFDSVRLKNFSGCSFQSFDFSMTNLKLENRFVILRRSTAIMEERIILLYVLTGQLLDSLDKILWKGMRRCVGAFDIARPTSATSPRYCP